MSLNLKEEITKPTLDHLNVEQLKNICTDIAREAGSLANSEPQNRLASLVETLAKVIETQLDKDLYQNL